MGEHKRIFRHKVEISAPTVLRTPLAVPAQPADAGPLGMGASRSWGPAVGGAIVVTGLFILWTRLQLGGAWATMAFTDVTTTVVPLTAAAMCAVAARRERGRARRGWALLGASMLSWALGNVVWTYYELVGGREVPFPSLADIGYLGAAPLGVAAVLSFPTAPMQRASQVRALLDGLIIGGSLLIVSWALVLGPLFRAGADTMLGGVVGLAYPVGDVITISIVIIAAIRARRGGRGPLALVGTGLIAVAVADSAFAYLTVNGEYTSGSVTGAGWVIGFLLIGLASLRPSPSGQAEANEERASQLGAVLPYGPVTAAIAVSCGEEVAHGALEPVLFWLATVVVTMLVARHLLTLLENVTLARSLETKVDLRTAELLESEQRFRSLVQNSSDVVAIVDAEGVVRYQSPSVSRVFGHDPEQIVGTEILSLAHPEDHARFRSLLCETTGQASPTAVAELRLRHRNGSWRQVEMTVNNLLENPAVRGLVLNTRDISERRALEDQLRHQAFHDPLTNLANRALFQDRVAHAVALGTRGFASLAILVLDLDAFKQINDSFGHAVGDELSVVVGQRLGQCVRPGDTVARLGGDEFAVLMESLTEPSEPARVAERILAALRTPFAVDGKELFMHASIGIATSPFGAATADELLRDADLAMYTAKSRGRDRFEVYETAMHDAVVERLEVEADLRGAVERDELVVYYQPIMVLRTGQISGVEALVRWQHPTRGLVPPDQFISIAEDTGLIIPIGAWVLRRACEQARAWNDERSDQAPLSMSVNLSARQLLEPALVDCVADILRESGLAPERLVLEITESMLLDDADSTIARLEQLKALGVRLAIDDFGTGYSSLSYLARLPVDVLKVDRAFVLNVGDGPEESALTQAIIKLGRTFGLTTVAEGVEQAEQVDALVAFGCELGQGFHFSKPLPAETLAPMIAQHSLMVG